LLRSLGVCSKEWLQNFREDETGGRDRDRYDDEEELCQFL